MPLRAAALLLALLSADSCVRHRAPADTAARERNAAIYRNGVIRVGDGEVCLFRQSAEDTEEKKYQCGSLIIELDRGVTDGQLRGILESLHGELTRDGRLTPSPWISVRVPIGSEITAILEALKDQRVASANLDWRIELH